MFKKVSASVLLVGLIYGVSFGADDFTLLLEERIGDLRVGLSEKEVKKSIHCKLKRGPERLWGADGAYHQEWVYAACGIRLGMVSDKKGGRKSVESVSVVGPCTLSTSKGIRIGSTEEEVMKAYRAHWNREDSEQLGKAFVADSIYGGMIFTFQDGQVTKIFLGAAAE
jgi:hypothetical protein